MQTGQEVSDGRVAFMFLHGQAGGALMEPRPVLQCVEGMGIEGNTRYFGRRSRSTGQPSVRQVSLIEREQIARHAADLGLTEIAPGLVRANIETEGIDLVSLIGRQIEIGTARLLICEARLPCAKMDAIHPGLRALMGNHRQGVLAQVVRSGEIRAGDAIRCVV